MLKKILAGASLLALSVASVYAATATGNLAVSLTYNGGCTVSGDTVVLASLSNIGGNGNSNATFNLPISCPAGASFTSILNYGSHASGTQRRMHFAGNYINYDLYSDAAYTVLFPDAGVSMTAGVGPITLPVYARLPAGQPAVPVGTYTDSIQVTINY